MISSCFLEGKLDPTIQVGAYLKQINGNYRLKINFICGKDLSVLSESIFFCWLVLFSDSPKLIISPLNVSQNFFTDSGTSSRLFFTSETDNRLLNEDLSK